MRGWRRQRLHWTYSDRGKTATSLELLASSFEPDPNDPGSELRSAERFFLVHSAVSATRNVVKEGAHITFGRIRKVMSRLRISAISYLNTAPLMWDFEHAETGQGADFEISYTIPSACAEALRAGAADIGIIPAAAYTTVPDLVIIPDVAIAARRAVRSILLVSKNASENVRKVPGAGISRDRDQDKNEWVGQVRTVALDTSSMTSVALAKILFAKWLGGARDYKPM